MPLKITFEGNELANYCRLEPDFYDVALLNGFSEAAKADAERFLNTDFHLIVIDPATGETAIVEKEAPAPVKLWVMDRVAQMYENRGNPSKPDYSELQPFRVYPFRG